MPRSPPFFCEAIMPAWLEKQLGAFLQQVHEPLSVRSSSLLEDALHKPFAGLFETYMLPNNNADHEVRLQQLVRAVKLVFASTFYAGPRAFSSETDKHASSPDSMAVIIQIPGRKSLRRLSLSGNFRHSKIIQLLSCRQDESR